MRKKVIISACLLGKRCRYDGKLKGLDSISKEYEGYEIIPFCPEDPLFGTPRERINVQKINGDIRIITDETKKDVTSMLEEEINSFIAKNSDADEIVLKSKSPSCGYKTTLVLDKDKNIIEYGNGIAAEMFLKHYKGIAILDENRFIK